MRLIANILVLLAAGVLPGGEAFFHPLQQRDTMLIADQFEYGFQMEGVAEGTAFSMPDFKQLANDTLVLVRGWQIDTLKFNKKQKTYDLRASVVLSPFEEGEYVLPKLPVLRNDGARVDSLLFDEVTLMVNTIPVDTATFEIKPIKGQIKYPVTFKEVATVGGIALAALALLAAAVLLIRKYALKGKKVEAVQEPAHVIALRELDKYRSNKYWAPERQKAYYSGITDALKNYIDARYGIDAPEMTTAELFDALKKGKELSPELYSQLKDLFETADFVKFAKHIVGDEDNAAALPLAVKFVTTTYQTELEEERKDVL